MLDLARLAAVSVVLVIPGISARPGPPGWIAGGYAGFLAYSPASASTSSTYQVAWL